MKRSKAFTLIELLAVIVILGILIGITTVSVNGIRKKQEAENRRNAYSAIFTGVKAYIAEHPELLDGAWVTWNANPNGEKEISLEGAFKEDYIDVDTNKYKDLIYNPSNGAFRTFIVGRCDSSGTKLYYELHDLETLRKNLNWAKNTKTIYYNDCGCEEQIGNTESSMLCIGNRASGTNSKDENLIY